MPQNTHLEIISEEARLFREPVAENSDHSAIESAATELAESLTWLPGTTSSGTLLERLAALKRSIQPLFAELDRGPAGQDVSDDFRWLYENARLLYSELQELRELRDLKDLPHVRTSTGQVVPRVLAIAQNLLEHLEFRFDEEALTQFLDAFQAVDVLALHELWTLVTVLKLVLLEQIAERGRALLPDRPSASFGVASCIRSLRGIGQTSWKEVIEPLIVFEKVLRQDPAHCYAQMDFDSRDLYRNELSNIANHSECSELEVARQALQLAQGAASQNFSDPRVRLRQMHIGYYLLDRGVEALHKRVGFKAPVRQKIQQWLHRNGVEAFLIGIEVLTFIIVLAVTTSLRMSFGWLLLAMLIVLLPSSQSAVQLINFFVTSILPPRLLPKFDFSEGVPNDCLTMVAVPSLLLSETQVRNLVQNLEVRFLGNHDRNIHFALLTDLPDAHEATREDSPLTTLCAELINELNEKYAGQHMGSFLMLHRHRVYNPRERAWMGWERKRGKLLDLNKLLRGRYDSFPIKVGDLSLLPQVRYVITLDADTELPRGTAHRMVGALAHPLNQAIVDPQKNVVIAGYGILQPRVGISVESTSRSRLASIYAGETGFDIYTRAVSDAYQDLFGEGIFTGKGIYEVDTLLRVLDRRFPRNALLSHDLIEGAYARAGLASDIEIIEDYPSHYSAYNRRKHRWLRGDWQICGWLRPRVQNESRDQVQNPISLISRWKILDNLRRSLVEPATFLMFLIGWLVARSPWYWTLATLSILLLPAIVECVIGLSRALFHFNATRASDTLSGFYAACINVFFNLTFLAHQTLLSLDAVIRASVRRIFTHRRLLEWETAAQAELGNQKRGPTDVYLTWTPFIAFALGFLIWMARPQAFFGALPILLLWASSTLVAQWLNRPSIAPRRQISKADMAFLRNSAMHTWRYFAEFSTEEHNWLIPDNVQEQPANVAARLSPTNLGLLLNARQVACEFGYLTVAEFAQHTLRTLASVSRLSRYKGHLLNWYDTRSLQPLAPLFVSSVDSGNLFASLWTLKHGSLDRLRQPILQPCLVKGLVDHLRVLAKARIFPRKLLVKLERQLETGDWLHAVFAIPEEIFDEAANPTRATKMTADLRWFREEARTRVIQIKQAVRDFAPWSSPDFDSLREHSALNLKVMDSVPLEDLPEFVVKLKDDLESVMGSAGPDAAPLYIRLRRRLAAAQENVARLIADIHTIAKTASTLADEMDFSFLLNRRRKLMSIGYELDSRTVHPACYDLLCTESRTAVFAAIAKEDIPEESWFLLGRAHTIDCGRPVLLSWTGTMFEYHMPSLWMRSFSNTLLDRSRIAALKSQQAYANRKGVPWGISESAYAKLDEAGNYQYHAFGLPQLSLRKPDVTALVISPYSTFLSLDLDPEGAIGNLRLMAGLNWFGSYGFYEAVDFKRPKRSWRTKGQIVRCWMAHHQGMSLLALANFLHGNIVQQWFHKERRVQATELLLHEKPVAHVHRRDIPRLVAA
jgi:cyclic beta-1,2-glucan synthetase